MWFGNGVLRRLGQEQVMSIDRLLQIVCNSSLIDSARMFGSGVDDAVCSLSRPACTCMDFVEYSRFCLVQHGFCLVQHQSS